MMLPLTLLHVLTWLERGNVISAHSQNLPSPSVLKELLVSLKVFDWSSHVLVKNDKLLQQLLATLTQIHLNLLTLSNNSQNVLHNV